MEVTRRIHKNLAVAQRASPAIIAVSASAFDVCEEGEKRGKRHGEAGENGMNNN